MKNKILIVIATVLLLFPKVNYGQAPTLGTAAGFVLFTSVGAVTNTGISQVTGHVGSNVGASTNFGNVNGVMESQNSATAACSTAVLSLYNQLAGTTAAFFPSSSLGGDTLLAGVYSVTGASTLSNTLTLNAQGNPNAVFIFKLQGAFSAAANAKVILINGALACNVFWKIEGLTSLATGVTMRGTIVTNNAAISMSAGDTLEGRAFTTAGAISINGVMAYTPIGCGSPILTGPIAPTLATTANYVLFSGIGPVTNTGITHVTGDVGTNSGLTTGFNPLFVNGVIHPIPDLSTIQCASDLGVVYTYLNGLTADIELLYPAQFGRNLVLTPHTYLLNAATTLTDTLFLNAQGNPNAVFVIKIYGALSTSTYSKIVLTNGTQSRNVYWLVNGAVSINDYSIFRGTIIANNGAISLATGVTLDGRALTTIGAVNVTAITANIPSAPSVVVPPLSKLVCVGDTARFIVSATGSGLTFQWRKGNVNLVNGSNISGVTNDTLTIFPVSYVDTAATYNVVIIRSGNVNDTTISVSLKINNPIITTEPINQNACIGNNVVFTIKTTGTGITYQWRKGTINLINGGNIQGATSDSLKINGLTLSDISANYNVIISGVCSPKDTSNYAALNISTTVINTEPTNQSTCLGSSAIFIVKSNGSGLTYQWRKGNTNMVNGANVTGATNDTLRILIATIADTAANYNIIVSGICATKDTSINVSLYFNAAINVINSPINQTVCSGSAVRFVTRATGAGLTYQWRKGNINLVNGLNITGVTADTLKINTATIADTATNYNVIISSICAAKDTSINVSLNINLPLVKTTIPSNQTVCSGSSVQFITKATGADLTYQWRKGNVNLVNGLNITGVTADTLKINTATIADTATNYNVIISSICAAKDTSINVSLSINLPLVKTTIPSNQTVCSGNPVQFITKATGAGLTYQWRKGNVNLVNGLNITGVTTDTLKINSATIADTATNYNVIISSICAAKDTSINVSLNISVAPVILTQPNNQTVCVGGSAIFTVLMSGSGFTYQWRKGNVDLTNGGNILGATTANLIINPVGVSDSAANYNLVITNACTFTVNSANVSLTVNSLPIAIATSNTPICEGNSINLSAQSVTGATYTWTGPNSFASNTQNPTIMSALLADSGNYSLVVTSNGCNSIKTNLNVIVKACQVTNFSIPAGFSPNGDGINDLFIISGIINYPSLSMSVYNRWGNLVFDASPYQNNWNGRSNSSVAISGEVLPIGTYFYIIDLGDGSPVRKGTIYLNK